MIKPDEWIALPWDRDYMSFKRDLLTTAVLVYMEALEARYTYPGILMVVKDELATYHGFEQRDAILYPIAARVCIERNIEP
jgi:hypothetical protein